MNCARLLCTDAISEQLVRERKKKKKTGCLLFKAVNVLSLVVTLLKGAQNVSPLMGVCVRACYCTVC